MKRNNKQQRKNMLKQKYTQTPWIKVAPAKIEMGTGYIIITSEGLSHEEMEGNIALIRTAPDLLAVLKFSYDILRSIYRGKNVSMEEIGSTLAPSEDVIAEAESRA